MACLNFVCKWCEKDVHLKWKFQHFWQKCRFLKLKMATMDIHCFVKLWFMIIQVLYNGEVVLPPTAPPHPICYQCRWALAPHMHVGLTVCAHHTCLGMDLWPTSQSLWAHDKNLVKLQCCSYLKSNDQIRSQFCTCHDCWAVMTCANLWPDWMIRLMRIKITIMFFFFFLLIISSKKLCGMIPRSIIATGLSNCFGKIIP